MLFLLIYYIKNNGWRFNIDKHYKERGLLMSIKSLGMKVSLIVTLMIAVIICIIVYIVSVQSDQLVEKIAAKEVAADNVTFVKELERLKQEALTSAELIAKSHDVVKAITSGDREMLKKVLKDQSGQLDLITVCDVNGNVIARMHSDQKDDLVLNQKALATALATGKGMSTIERGTVVGLSTRGSAVILDFDGNTIGALTCGHDLSDNKYVDSVKSSTSNEATFFEGDTRISSTLIDEKGNRVVGTKASDTVVEKVIKQKQHFSLQITLFGNEYFAHYSPLIVDNEVVGMLFTGVPIGEALGLQQAMMNWVIAAGIICGIVCIVLVIIFNIFAVSRPLKKIDLFAERIRNGDIGVAKSTEATLNIRSRDEIGEVARALEAAYAHLRGYVREISDRMHGLNDGDLVTESAYDFDGDFILIRDAINEHIRTLNHTMTEINNSSMRVAASAKHIDETSSSLATGASQMADGAQSLADGALKQSEYVQELSSSVAEIADKTKENVDMTGQAAQLADNIITIAEAGNRKMDEMITAVNDINEASTSVSNIMETISGIAEQTNLLALNAAIEAARAGEHGKGFAVVAEEVRKLAAQSEEAVKETSTIIHASIEKAELGTRIAGEMAESLAEIVEGINESSRLNMEIAKASAEQLTGIAHINASVNQVADIIQNNSAVAQENAATAEESAAAAEESAAASGEMSSQYDILKELITQFKL